MERCICFGSELVLLSLNDIEMYIELLYQSSYSQHTDMLELKE